MPLGVLSAVARNPLQLPLPPWLCRQACGRAASWLCSRASRPLVAAPAPPQQHVGVERVLIKLELREVHEVDKSSGLREGSLHA